MELSTCTVGCQLLSERVIVCPEEAPNWMFLESAVSAAAVSTVALVPASIFSPFHSVLSAILSISESRA
jgi:hypothetical protein